jgi:rare lipoprotein A (peptidoglycan hydrolase)
MLIANGSKRLAARKHLALAMAFFSVSCSGTYYMVVKNNMYAKTSSKKDSSCGAIEVKRGGKYKVGKPYKIFGKEYCPGEDSSYRETGIASWYGEGFHNRKTANGDTFSMHDMTAAHRTLPMPSVVKVANLENGKSVLLVVNDRGPFVNDRIIDVSRRAAEELGFLEKGTTKVRVEFMEKETKKFLKSSGLL